MRSIPRYIMLILSLTGFAYSLLLLADHWEYEEMPNNVEEKFKQRVSTKQITTEIDKLIQADELEEARRIVLLAKHFDYPLDYNAYRNRIDELDSLERRARKGIGDFVDGFASGKGNSGAGFAGALASDFTVVGDVRDLHSQYQLHQEGKPVNDLIVGLSGVGIGLTAATIGSGGMAAPAKAGTSLIKLAGKTGRLSKRFSKELVVKAQKAFNWQTFTRITKSDASLKGIKRAAGEAFNPRAMKALSNLADQTNAIRKATSTVDTVHLLKYIENSDDLRRMQKVAVKHGTYTKGIMKFLGKGALRGAKVLKKTIGLIMSAISLFLSFILSVYFMFPATSVRKS